MHRLALLVGLFGVGCAHPVLVASPEVELAAINARCAVLASAATRDSQVVDVATVVNAVDADHELSREYRQMIGQGVRQFLIVPQPLALDTYDQNVEANGYQTDLPSRFTAMTLRGLYRATLRRDGHLVHVRAMADGPEQGFDKAVVEALAALDTSGLLPPPPNDASWFSGDTAELSVLVAAKSVRRVPGRVYPEDLTWSEPLLRLRVPVHRIEREASRISGPDPSYPENLAREATTGKVVMQFVVDIDGSVDMASIHVLAPVPRIEFVNATFDAVRRSRFSPMIVAGCPVRTLIEQPFVFLVR
jgi:TonB family protein